MVNMSDKFDQEAPNGLVAIVSTSLFPYMSIVSLIFDSWPPKSIGYVCETMMLPAAPKSKKTCI